MYYENALSQKKLEFIMKVMDETCLGTLSSWLDMYEKSRYVVSLDSDEADLKVFWREFEDSIRYGFQKF